MGRPDRADQVREILKVMTAIATGDLDARCSTSEHDEELDAIAVGLNLIAEELGASLAAVAEREAWYRSLVRNAYDVIFVTDADGVIEDAGGNYRRLTGYTSAELIGSNVFSHLVRLEDRGEPTPLRDELVRGPGQSRTGRYLLRRSDDTTVIAEVVVANQLAEPVLAGLVVNMHDVTEVHEAEQELRVRELRNRSVLEHAFGATLIVDRTGTVRQILGGYRDLLGFDPTESIGNRFDEIVHDEDVADVVNAIAAAADGEVHTFVARARTADGAWRVLAARVANLLYEPSVNGIVLNLRDATEQQASDLARAESDARFRRIFYRGPYPMWQYEVHSLRIIDVNQAAIEKYGYSREEFLTLTLDDIEIDHVRLHRHIRSGRPEGDTDYWHHRLRDGTEIPVEVTGIDFTFGGREIRLVIAVEVSADDRVPARREERPSPN